MLSIVYVFIIYAVDIEEYVFFPVDFKRRIHFSIFFRCLFVYKWSDKSNMWICVNHQYLTTWNRQRKGERPYKWKWKFTNLKPDIKHDLNTFKSTVFIYLTMTQSVRLLMINMCSTRKGWNLFLYIYWYLIPSDFVLL